MSEVKALVGVIIRFLGDQQRVGGLDEESLESLDVAKQCLETAYSVSSDTQHAPLLDIFREGIKHVKPEAPKETSAEDKAAGDRLKGEGNVRMKEEKYQEALDCYSRAIEKDGRNAVYFCNRAAAFSKLNDHQSSLEDCLKALEIDPNYSKAFGRKGLAHTALNQHHAARDCYKKALELDPGNESYKNNMQLAEQKITEGGGSTAAAAPPNPFGAGGLNLGGLDIGGLLNNPGLMEMASSMMANPQMQQMMASMMSGNVQGGSQGMEGLMEAGQTLAQQMQQSNPDLVDELRNRYRSQGDNNPDNPPQPPPSDA